MLDPENKQQRKFVESKFSGVLLSCLVLHRGSLFDKQLDPLLQQLQHKRH